MSVSEQCFINKSEICALTLQAVENARPVRDHFQKVYNIKSELNPEVLSKIEQRPITLEWMDDPPTLDEMHKAQVSKKEKPQATRKYQLNYGRSLQRASLKNIFFMKSVLECGRRLNVKRNGSPIGSNFCQLGKEK